MGFKRSIDNSSALMAEALEAGEGILRLTPTWVPRSFLTPGKRLKLHPNDYYAMGAHRGGIDERWFASTTEAANDNREPDEGLSYVLYKGKQFLLRDAVKELGGKLIGDRIWNKYKKWPSTPSSLTTWGRSRITCTRTANRLPRLARKVSLNRITSRRK